MAPRPHRPSGKSEPGAIPLLFLGCVLVGGLAGVAEAFIANYLISLLVIFPLLVGLAVGGFASWRIGVTRIRAPALAAAAGLLGGLAGQVAVDRMEYEFFRQAVTREVRAEHPEADPAAVLDAYLQEHTGSSGWAGFVKLQAEKGITITHGSSDGMTLTGVGAYILWVVELFLAAGAAAGIAFGRASRPFCEHCRSWYDQEKCLALGSAEKAAWREVAASLERGDAAGALAARGAPAPKARSALWLQRCSRCEAHEPVFRIQVTKDLHAKKPKDQRVYRTTLRWPEAKALLDAVAAEQDAARPAAGG